VICFLHTSCKYFFHEPQSFWKSMYFRRFKVECIHSFTTTWGLISQALLWIILMTLLKNSKRYKSEQKTYFLSFSGCSDSIFHIWVAKSKAQLGSSQNCKEQRPCRGLAVTPATSWSHQTCDILLHLATRYCPFSNLLCLHLVFRQRSGGTFRMFYHLNLFASMTNMSRQRYQLLLSRILLVLPIQ
jgi:hypothetical protein